MKKGSVFVYIVIVFLVSVAFFSGVFFLLQRSSTPESFTNRMSPLRLTSSVFSNNTAIPSKYTCDGDDINPPLLIAGVPEGVKSFALIMDDPDAPMGIWDHWILWNINPKTNLISENSVPQDAVQGSTSWGKDYQKYGGPCPPSGTHRYFFKLYALDSVLDLAPGATKKEVERATEGHALDKAELVGIYQRKK